MCQFRGFQYGYHKPKAQPLIRPQEVVKATIFPFPYQYVHIPPRTYKPSIQPCLTPLVHLGLIALCSPTKKHGVRFQTRVLFVCFNSLIYPET